MLVQVRGILRERPEGGGTTPFRLWQGLPRARPDPHSPLGVPRGLLPRLAQGWEGYCLHRRDSRAPNTLVPASRP
jgi:hypothetical protein